MIFRVRALGQAASGHLDVADDHVRLEVTLPWLLQRFAEVAQVAIRNRGNLLLTKRELNLFEARALQARMRFWRAVEAPAYSGTATP